MNSTQLVRLKTHIDLQGNMIQHNCQQEESLINKNISLQKKKIYNPCWKKKTPTKQKPTNNPQHLKNLLKCKPLKNC